MSSSNRVLRLFGAALIPAMFVGAAGCPGPGLPDNHPGSALAERVSQARTDEERYQALSEMLPGTSGSIASGPKPPRGTTHHR